MLGAQALAPLIAPGVPTVVASRALPAHTTITEDDLALVRLPREAIPVGALSQPHEFLERLSLGPIAQGSPLTPDMFTETGTGIEKGRALISVPVHDRLLLERIHRDSRVHIHCSLASMSGHDAAAPLSPVTGIVREIPPPAGPSSPLTASETPSIIVDINASDITTIAHCTREGSLCVAVIG